MPRTSRDGRPARPTNKRNFTDRFVRTIVPDLNRVVIAWDARQPGLCLAVHPTGRKMWRVVYRRSARPIWLTLGDARSISLSDARKLAAGVALEVALGKDPAAERRADRRAGTFAELAQRYVDEWSSKRNKSWRKTDATVQRVLIPRWGKLRAKAISRADVRALLARIPSPSAADMALAAASAIFTFGVNMEARNPRRSLERTLSDREIALVWNDLDVALKLVVLTAARPGEVF